MSGTSAGSPLSRRRFLRPALACALLLAGLPRIAAATGPIVELKFDEATGTSTSNTGWVGGTATLSTTTPSRSTNTPIQGGAHALDFGTAEGNYYADITASNTLNAVKSLKSFTIAGWINCRSAQSNFGGGRIVSWFRGTAGLGGVDLASRSDGSLALGVDTWNDLGGITSNSAKIPVDANASYNNWRFFAVTYDGTASSNNVKFYFGTNNVAASLDKTVTLNQGTTAGSIASSLTIGNTPLTQRTTDGPYTSVFRGLIDQVRIYGSTSNTSGVLPLDQIQALQQASSLMNVQGVVYEQWNGISGNTLSSLFSDPRYPYNPSLTKLQSNFEGFTNSANNYGARVSGWVKAPTTGTYTFWIVGDDNAQLWVSTDANPDNKRLIASVATYNSGPDAWDQFGSQKSEPITLQANQHYYVEALVKEGDGGDFVRVGWQLPSGTQERPIPQARVVTSPPDAVPFYPSVYPLYEPGTFAKKAAMGWQKEEGNDHFYIKTDETKALIAKNGTAIFPERLFFGGLYPNYPIDNTKGDLGFRYERGVESAVGVLNLENQAGEWALRAFSSAGDVQPHVQFNNSISLVATPYVAPGGAVWNGSATIHHVEGAKFERGLTLPNPGDTYAQSAAYHGGGATLLREWSESGFFLAETTSVIAGSMTVKAKNPYGTTVGTATLGAFSLGFEVSDTGVVQHTSALTAEALTIDDVFAKRVHTDSLHATKVVTTPKWRVASSLPDYVFEKEYKLRSLEETERFVREKKHLPEIPSAREMSAKGIDLADMNMQLLKKVEELTLHMIALDKELKSQRRDNRRMEQDMRALRGAGKGN